MRKNWFFLLAAALGLLAGCGYVPMTARSRLVVSGDVVEETTTSTTDEKGVTTVTKTVVTKSQSAGDLEIKKAEIQGRTKVGAAQAEERGWWSTPPYYGGGYYYPPYPYYGGGGGYYGGGWVTPYNFPSLHRHHHHR